MSLGNAHPLLVGLCGQLRRVTRGASWIMIWACVCNLSVRSADETIEQLIDRRVNGLLDKMVRKGVISADQAAELKEEDDKPSGGFITSLVANPEWLQSIRLSGDLRMRFEHIHASDGLFPDRDRFRYRVRIGSQMALKDKFELGLRLSSGEPGRGTTSGDPISGNATFGQNASKKPIYLDLVYARYNTTIADGVKGVTTLGKMETPFVFAAPFFFDKDYTPEGFSQDFFYRINNQHTLRGIAGAFVINEYSLSSSDPYWWAAQLHLASKWSEKLTTGLGVGYFPVIAGTVQTNRNALATDLVPDQQTGNTRDGIGNPIAKFDPIYSEASVTYLMDTFPLYKGACPITVSGDFFYNPGAKKNNEGYTVGMTLGKLEGRRTYEISYRYATIEADSWYEEFTESDFGGFYEGFPRGSNLPLGGYGTGTNVRGHIVRLSYAVTDSFTLGTTVFFSELINELPAVPSINANSRAVRVQIDGTWRF